MSQVKSQKEEVKNSFSFEWVGSRVPKEVTFPDGTSKQVQYMRDGLICFLNEGHANYVRLVDTVDEQKILVVLTPAQIALGLIQTKKITRYERIMKGSTVTS